MHAFGPFGYYIRVQRIKALSHWQFFVLHDRATQLINSSILFLLSNTIARLCNCCMQVLHKGVINIDELSNTIARTCNRCMQVLHKGVINIDELSNTIEQHFLTGAIREQ